MSFTSWSQIQASAAFSGKKGARAVSHNGAMYLTGGDESTTPKSTEVWKSTDGITWALLTSSPGWAGRSVHGCVSDGTYIYVFGGSSGAVLNVFYNDIWRSADGITWVQMNATCDWDYRHEFGFAYMGGAIYVYGGYKRTTPGGSSSRCNDVWKSIDGGLNWTSLGDASWDDRREMAYGTYDSKIWCLGGDATSGWKNDVWWSSDGSSWTQQSNAPWTTRREHQAFEFDSKLWIVSGTQYSPRVYMNDTWYTPDGENWTQYVTSPDYTARADAAVVFFNNGVYIIAGES